MTDLETALFQAQPETYKQLTSNLDRLVGDANTITCLETTLLPGEGNPKAKVLLRFSQGGGLHHLYEFVISEDNTIDLSTYKGRHYRLDTDAGKNIDPPPALDRILILARQTVSSDGQIPREFFETFRL